MASLKRNECERDVNRNFWYSTHTSEHVEKSLTNHLRTTEAVDNSKANTQLIRPSQRKRWSITESQLLTLICLIIQWYSTVTVSKQTPCLDTVS